VAGPDRLEPDGRRTQPPHVVLVLHRLHGDVVAEPPGLLVGVGMAADVDEQRRVVDGRALVLVQAGPLRDPQRDQALAQHVFHGLAEPEVDAERQRGDQLRQPDARAAGPVDRTRL